MKNLLRYIKHILVVVIAGWITKASATPIDTNLSYYGNSNRYVVDFDQVEPQNWYDFITKPLFYLTMIPVILIVGASWILIRHSRKRKNAKKNIQRWTLVKLLRKRKNAKKNIQNRRK